MERVDRRHHNQSQDVSQRILPMKSVEEMSPDGRAEGGGWFSGGAAPVVRNVRAGFTRRACRAFPSTAAGRPCAGGRGRCGVHGRHGQNRPGCKTAAGQTRSGDRSGKHAVSHPRYRCPAARWFGGRSQGPPGIIRMGFVWVKNKGATRPRNFQTRGRANEDNKRREKQLRGGGKGCSKLYKSII